MPKYAWLCCFALACARPAVNMPHNLASTHSPARTALQAGDFSLAASLFSQTCLQNPALYADDCLQAGKWWMELQQWEEAERVLKPIANPLGEDIALEASFSLAICHYERGQLSQAALLLQPMAQRAELEKRWRLRAQTEYAICLLEQGARADAQHLLETVAATSPPPVDELEKAAWAKAKFFLAEMAFLRFAEYPFCHPCSVHVMARDVEHKAQLLLLAQQLFVQTIQAHHNYWAIAAGMRIGELYETLYQQLLASTPPLEIRPEEHASYREQMRTILRGLQGKALQNYEDTLHTAERIGTTGFFTGQTRERLHQLTRQLLQSPDEPHLPHDAPHLPHDAAPSP